MVNLNPIHVQCQVMMGEIETPLWCKLACLQTEMQAKLTELLL